MGKRCSLCGGKLDGRNICRECGLDNSKSDSDYTVRYHDQPHSGSQSGTGSSFRPSGQSRTGDSSRAGSSFRPSSQPGTAGRTRPGSRINQNQWENAQGQSAWNYGERVDTSVYPSGNIGKPQKKKRGCLIVSGIVVVIVIIIVIVAALAIFENEYGESSVETYTYDPYEWVEEELPEKGEKAEYTLLQGSYVVGVHIPAGNYKAEAEREYDWVKVTDWDRGIFLFEYEEKSEGNRLDDLRLFDGAVVEIGEYGPVKFTTSNAQISDMKGIPNPLTEGWSIEGEKELRAGKDFPAGVYDAELAEGLGMAELTVYYEDEEKDTKWFYFDSEEGRFCKNIVIPEGAKFSCDEGMRLLLTPSELIETEDYLNYYKIHEGRYEEYGE